MATVKIPGSPSSFRLREYGVYEDVTVVFSLADLGVNPTITAASFLCDLSKQSSMRVSLMREGHTASIANDATKYDYSAMVTSALSGGSLTLYLRILHPGTVVSSVSNIQLEVTTAGDIIKNDKPSPVTTNKTNVEFGGSFTATVAPYSDTFSHALQFTLGSLSQTVTLASGSVSYTFTVPTSWMSALPSANSGMLTITATTMNGSTTVGTTSTKVMVSVPDGIKPSIGSMTVTAVNTGALSGDTRYFKGATSCAIVLSTVVAGQGSSIKSITYSGWGGSATSTATSYTSDPVKTSGSVTIRAVVTDTRGRTAQISRSITVLNYTLPAFESIVASRCLNDGTETDQGTAVKVLAQFSCDTESISGNTATATVAFRRGSSGTWSSEYSLTNNTETIITGANLSADHGYTMRFTVTDSVTSSEIFMELPSAVYVIHFSNGGNSVAIGQASETPAQGEVGRFAVNPDWDVYLGVNVHIGNQTLAAYIQSIIAGQ